MAGAVTATLRFFLQHNTVCNHYNLTPRVLSFSEMETNLCSVLKIYSKYAVFYSGRIRVWLNKEYLFYRYTLALIKLCIKEMFVPFEQIPLKLDR